MSEISKASGERNARGPTIRPVIGDKIEHPTFVRIDCPFPLLTAGLVSALERAQLRLQQGPVEAGVPCIVVLWAEDVEDLAESVERVWKLNPNASILVFGLREDMPLAVAALEAGARGFIHAGMKPEQVARAISVAAEGKVVAPRELLEYLLAKISGEKPVAEHGALRPRHREVLELVAEGLSNAQIAKRLFLSESTVKQHLRAAYKALGVQNRTEAAKLVRDAYAQGRRTNG